MIQVLRKIGLFFQPFWGRSAGMEWGLLSTRYVSGPARLHSITEGWHSLPNMGPWYISEVLSPSLPVPESYLTNCWLQVHRFMIPPELSATRCGLHQQTEFALSLWRWTVSVAWPQSTFWLSPIFQFSYLPGPPPQKRVTGAVVKVRPYAKRRPPYIIISGERLWVFM